MVIVAAVDTDEQAGSIVKEGLSLARAFDDSLSVVHAVPSTEFAAIQREHVSAGGDTLSRDDVARDHIHGALGSEALSGDVDVEFVGLDGEPTDSILEHAADVDARYVVIGGKGRSPAGKALFGSVAQTVILEADCSVVVGGA